MPWEKAGRYDGAERPGCMSDTLDRGELDQLFTFLARIQKEPALREQLNQVQTAPEVSDIAGLSGHSFRPETLIAVFEQCNEQPYAREGLMDEKLIRVYLRRDSIH
ncbi:MAG: Nif11-like leader peptide family natural product precursor [Synechococcaceae cyanobacterium]|nr:Nif11-like leader peptide family natural product precursor [Synechococcaceae cyanobacterium]